MHAWRANAQTALQQLHDDVAATDAVGGDTPADARRALHDDSALYALVVAYTDLGGCTTIMRNTSAPPAVVVALLRPCRPLESAAAAFSLAVRTSNEHALVRARTDADRALPLLIQALAEVKRA